MDNKLPQPDSGLSNQSNQKTEWALRRSITEGSFAAVMGNLAGGVFLTGFALSFGASTFYIGLLSSLPPIISLVQLFTPSILRRFGGKRKELTIATFGGARLLWLLLVILPFLFFIRQTNIPLWIIIITICISTGFNSIGGITWFSWMGDLVPRNRLGRYFSNRNLYNGFVGMFTALAGGIVFDLWNNHTTGPFQIYGFSAVFLIGLIFGMLSLFLMKGIPEPQLRIAAHNATPWKEMWIPLKDKNFRRFTFTRMFWLFSLWFASPFFTVFLIKNIKLDYTSIQFFFLLAGIISLYCARFWGRLSDQFGNRPVLMLSYVVKGLYCFAYLPVTLNNFWIALTIVQLFSCLDSGLDLTASNLLLKLSPRGNNTAYLATYTACMNLSLAMAPLIGGWVVTRFAVQDMFIFGSHQIEALKFIFLVSGILRILSAPLLYLVREPETASLGYMFRVLREVKGVVPRVGELNETLSFWFAPVTDMMYAVRWRSRRFQNKIKNMVKEQKDEEPEE